MKIEVIHTAFENSPQTVAMVKVGKDTHPYLGGDHPIKTMEDALDHAYVCTQNVYDSWSMKGDHDGCDDVTVLGKLPKVKGQLFGIRSTSVDDILVVRRFFGLKKTSYRVSSVGFEKLEVA